jgi:hypothetical protein
MSDASDEWFPRSGACLVAAALFAEFASSFGPYSTSTYQATRVLLFLRSVATTTGYLLAVVGTIIWAYGDFIHTKLL